MHDTRTETPDPLTDAEQEVELELLVRRMTWEADGVLSLELTHPDGRELPAWSPGAHLDVRTGGQIRQYSLCGDPDDRRTYRIGVLKEPSSRGGSVHLHTRVRPGDRLTVKGPRNRFPLVDAPGYLLIAGGIGITPLLTMAADADRRGVPWRLVYGGRHRASMAFTEELRQLAGRKGELSLHPQDEYGLLDLTDVLSGLDERTPVYCCGPEPLLAAVEERCTALGVRDRLHIERFAAVPVAPPANGETGFEVEAVRSGRTVQVGPEQSIVDALESAGVTVETSCRDGICGTCETKVLDGEPDHRDMLLSPAEQESGQSMMICVSRCASRRLALDL